MLASNTVVTILPEVMTISAVVTNVPPSIFNLVVPAPVKAL